VQKVFQTRRLLLGRSDLIRAVDGVSFSIAPKRVLGIAGESGSGKSTLANLLVGLELPDNGVIRIAGRTLGRRPDREFRLAVQMVFQDPFGSLNPRFTVRRSVSEPLVIHGPRDPAERHRRTLQALEDAELRPGAAFLDRYPHELSGGQRQRVAIARAIVLRPRLLVADEPVSMLDVSVRAGILRLLQRLVREGDMSMVLITHDLSIVSSVCEELAIMYRGRFVEHGPVLEVLRRPAHPYTRALIDAVPVPDPAVPPAPLPAKLVSGATAPAQGCRFAPRCEWAIAECERRDPELAEVGRSHQAACIRVHEVMA